MNLHRTYWMRMNFNWIYQKKMCLFKIQVCTWLVHLEFCFVNCIRNSDNSITTIKEPNATSHKDNDRWSSNVWEEKKKSSFMNYGYWSVKWAFSKALEVNKHKMPFRILTVWHSWMCSIIRCYIRRNIA